MVVAAASATKIDPTVLLIGAGALLLLTGWGIEKIIPEVRDKANIVPESKEFLSGLLYGAESDYFYAADQSGSPNPPTQAWWEMAKDLGATDAGPIPVQTGTAVPTSPIIGVHPPGRAERYGGNVRDWFTEGQLFEYLPF
tara:strand:- start:206 stop:625 length:420 start_codon:yes stop_codon:yes gene_type:complete